jgi:hypothetical protein
MLNSAFLQEQSQELASFVKRTANSDRAAQVKLALTRVMQREPTEKEIKRGLALINSLEADGESADLAFQHFCLAALNLNEFVYLD